MHFRNNENANDGKVDWRVRGKKPCPLNKIGQVKKWLSHQLALGDRGHNDCVFIPNSRIDDISRNGIENTTTLCKGG